MQGARLGTPSEFLESRSVKKVISAEDQAGQLGHAYEPATWIEAQDSTEFPHVDNSKETIRRVPCPPTPCLPDAPEFRGRQEFSAAQGKKRSDYFRKLALNEFRSTLIPFRVCSNFCWIPTRMVLAVFQPPYCTGAGAR